MSPAVHAPHLGGRPRAFQQQAAGLQLLLCLRRCSRRPPRRLARGRRRGLPGGGREGGNPRLHRLQGRHLLLQHLRTPPRQHAQHAYFLLVICPPTQFGLQEPIGILSRKKLTRQGKQRQDFISGHAERASRTVCLRRRLWENMQLSGFSHRCRIPSNCLGSGVSTYTNIPHGCRPVTTGLRLQSSGLIDQGIDASLCNAFLEYKPTLWFTTPLIFKYISLSVITSTDRLVSI